MSEPLEGILKTGDYGDSKHYHIVCSCGDVDHAHDVNVEIEADDCDVSVHVFLTVGNDYWIETFKRRRKYDDSWSEWFDNTWKAPVNAFLRKLKFTWEVWVKGETTFQTTMCLSEAAAKNYSCALDKAADDVKLFRQERMNKNGKGTSN
jgi:hypothetical protein